jgi:hypothetical protein
VHRLVDLLSGSTWVSTEEAGRMDITTVNDRHLYQGRVVVEDPASPSRQIELPRRIVRFGPAGWLTVMAAVTEGAEIELYPVGRVLAVTDLREVGPPGHQATGGR